MTAAPTIRAGDRWFAALQYILPKRLLSRVIYAVARSEVRWIRNTFLRIFLSVYRLNMAEAVQPDPFAYRSFNDFFTRALRPGVRPIDGDSYSVDHTTSVFLIDPDGAMRALFSAPHTPQLIADDYRRITGA